MGSNNNFKIGEFREVTVADQQLKDIELLKRNNQSILDEAKDITGNNRMEAYGHPKHNFEDIANFWTAYLKNKKYDSRHSKLENTDVALMMVQFKIAREQSGHKRDNLVDIAGYARNVAQIKGFE